MCHYQQKQYGPALKLIAEIIERGVREHPELSVGSQTEGIDVRSVGNSLVLKETALIEARPPRANAARPPAPPVPQHCRAAAAFAVDAAIVVVPLRLSWSCCVRC